MHEPARKAFTFLSEQGEADSLTYRELDLWARAIAARLLDGRPEPGSRVLLLYPPGLDYVAGLFGCLYADLVAVPAYPPRTSRSWPRLKALLADAGATVALTVTSMVGKVEAAILQTVDSPLVRCLATDRLRLEGDAGWREPAAGADASAILQYTSGSTGTPKGVILTHGNLAHNSRVIREKLRHDAESRGVIWLPPYHDMGLIGGILQPIWAGFPCVLMTPTAFLQRPLTWLEAVSRFRATTSGGPNFAYELCVRKTTPEQRATLDLSAWTVAFNGAEPVRQETLDRFAAAFGPSGFRPEAFYPCYGLAEATLFVTGGARGSGPVVRVVRGEPLAHNEVVEAGAGDPTGRPLVGCGRSAPEHRIAIVDPDSLAGCPPDRVGEVWVSGPSVAQGYWNQPDETRRTFRAYLADTGDGPFLRTGDLGFLRSEELFVTGRLKDLIVIHGRNHYPQDIEATAERSHPALRPGCGAAFSLTLDGEERLVVAHEVEYRRRPDLHEVVGAVRAAVAEEHGLSVYGVALLRPGTIPKTSSGKTRRQACRDAYLAGRLELIDEWRQRLTPGPRGERPPADGAAPARLSPAPHPAEAIERWVVTALSKRLGVDPAEVDVRQPFSRYGLGSVEAVSLAGELGTWLGRPVPATLAWDYPTVAALSRHLAGEPPDTRPAPSPAARVEREPIAIVGIGCRLPGAEDPDAFWRMLRDGGDAITEVPADRWDRDAFYHPEPATPGRMNTRWGGFIPGVDQFDAQFFGIAPREAARMDPQQRVLLEVAWEALEEGGQAPDRLAGTDTAVFIGISGNEYLQLQCEDPARIDAYAGTGNALSIAANRLSYLLDLRGPSVAVDTACSSSLVAVHLACQSLWSGESRLALAGGVNLILSPTLTLAFSQARMMAADGRCKTFDARADGYVRSEGCGVVVLKRLSDARADRDRVLAVIRGSAVNQDGRSNGLTAPNGSAQEAVIRAALRSAGLSPVEVSYVEAHGTGTALGDPIEVGALAAVLDEGRRDDEPYVVGSVKTNIGHLEAAAGIAGLIKVVLALAHGEIPPHLHLRRLNPHIRANNGRPVIATTRTPWPRPGGRRFAGVSSFGFGGTNAHVVLGEAPAPPPPGVTAERPLHVFTLSARSDGALRALCQGVGRRLAAPGTRLPDVCFTANAGRAQLPHRLAVVVGTREALCDRLEAFAAAGRATGARSGRVRGSGRPKLAFMFTGQGSQYAGMGGELYATQPTFRRALDRCGEVLRPHLDVPLLRCLYPGRDEPPRLDDTEVTQPALFSLEYALAELWRSWGVEPDAVLGHSLGEYVAACVAGVMSLEDALRLVAARGRLMGALPGGGSMVAVAAAESAVAPRIEAYGDDVGVAACNGPELTVLSGRAGTLARLIAAFESEGVACQRLPVSVAFHSPLVEPMLAEFARVIGTVSFHQPSLPLVSNVTGEFLDAPPSAAYWLRQTREPVRFGPSVAYLADRGYRAFLEVGAKPMLCGLVKRILPCGTDDALVLPSLPAAASPDAGHEWRTLLASVADLYVHGFGIDWERFDRDYERTRVSLPTYPFERERYWIEPSPTRAPRREELFDGRQTAHPLLGRRMRA
jgi:acyl transferase domain-containing protein/acyl-CoA synthetase (AMP-forming)/AMP-acid ligase II/acyl carrier protein